MHVVPLKVHWGEETYRDGVDISVNEFYRRLAQSKELPTTSQPSVKDFSQIFETAAQSADAIIAPLISSGISVHRGNRPARAGVEFTRIPVEIVDTRITLDGTGAYHPGDCAGIGAGEIPSRGQADCRGYAARRLHVYLAVDALEYLHRGGRINLLPPRYLGTVLRVQADLILHRGREDRRVRNGYAPPRKALQRSARAC
ncbi:MAG: DegV family EDD domain-containing protein [Desulfobacterales bacterium]|nr:DegV family EDD domain-containing protein [Desulfobacterales bacterium]